jgi:tetratricopeptide (TPR) repeat protein
MRILSAALLFALLLGWQSAGAAQQRRRRAAPPPPDTTQPTTDDLAARGRFDAGLAFYEDGRFEEALVDFEAAWQLSQRPEMLINIANAAERALKFDVAIEHLQLFLERSPNAPDREAIERRIARDQSTLARANAPVSSLTTPAGSNVAPAADPPSGGGAPVAAIVTLGAAGALAIGAVITGLVAHGTYSDLESACPGGVCPPDRQSDLDSGETMALVSTVLTGLAVVAGGVGLVLLFVGGSDDEAPADRARLELAPGPTPLGATARVRF